MIEPSAVVLGPSQIHADAYVGHFAVIGSPRRVRPQPAASNKSQALPTFWEPSRGVSIGQGAVVSSHVVIDDQARLEPGVWIGSGVRIGHETVIQSGAELYYRCQVYDRVVIGRQAVVGGFVCNDARIGARAQIFGSLVHRLVNAPKGATDPHPTEVESPPIIDDDVVVGVGAVVIGGIRVGRAAYIAAGSVLTKDAEEGLLYAGVPARPVGEAPRPYRPD